MISPAVWPATAGASGQPRGQRGGVWLLPGLLITAMILIGVHLIVLHEGPRWASPLLFGDWLFTVAFALAVLLYSLDLGRLAARPLLGLDEDGLLDHLAALGLGFGGLFTAILCLGFVRLYYGPLFLALWLVYTLARRRHLHAIVQDCAASIVRWARTGFSTAPSLSQRIVLLVVTVALLHVALRTMLPMSDWDAVTYHLAAPKIYLALHMIVPLPNLPLAMAPSGEEMVLLMGLAAGTDGLGKVLMLAFTLLLALATYTLTRRIGHAAAGWIAVLAMCTMLWLVAVMPLTLTDGVGAFLLVVGVTDLVAWSVTPTDADPVGAATLLGRPGRRLVRAGLLVGLAGATKMTNLPAIPALVGTAGVVCLLAPGVRLMPRLRTAIAAGFVAGAASLIAVGPWLLKSWCFFGRPLYPSSLQVSNPSQGVVIAAVPAPVESHLRWMLDTLGDFMVHHVGLLTLPLILAPLLWRRSGPRALSMFLASSLVLRLLYVPYFDPPRYYLGLAALTLALATTVSYRIGDWLRVSTQGVDWLLSAVVLLQALPVLTVGLGELHDANLLLVARGGVSRYAWLAQHVRPYLAEQWANEHAAPGGPIALVNVLPGYYMNRPYLTDWYAERFARLEASPASLQAELALWCRAQVRYAVFDRGDGLPDFYANNIIHPLDSFAWTGAAGLAVRAVYTANGVDVLMVSPCAAAHPVHAR